MKTELYQEQPEQAGGGAVVATPSVEQRVAEVKRRIMAEVASGRCMLSKQGTYQFGVGDGCEGCALGVLAFSLTHKVTDSRKGSDLLRQQVVDEGLVTNDEVCELEAGFENLSLEGYKSGQTLWGRTLSRALGNGPFWQLGQELRSLAR